MFEEESGSENIFQVDGNFISTLLNGLTVGDLPSANILVAVDRLANLSSEDKVTVVAKICYFFYASEYDNFSRLTDEDPDEYASRICQLIAIKVNANLVAIADEAKQKSNYQECLAENTTAGVNSISSSSSVKSPAFSGSPSVPFAYPSPVTIRPVGRLGSPVYSASLSPNLAMRPNFQVATANGVALSSPMKASPPLPSDASTQRSALFRKTQQHQQWFFHLSQGKFSDAMAIESQLAEDHVTINYSLTDEFGKTIYDYACAHVDRLVGVLSNASELQEKLNNLLPLIEELNNIKRCLDSLEQTSNIQSSFWGKVYEFDGKLAGSHSVFIVNDADAARALFRQVLELNNQHYIGDLLQKHKALVASGEEDPPSVLQLMISSPFQFGSRGLVSPDHWAVGMRSGHDIEGVVAQLFSDDELGEADLQPGSEEPVGEASGGVTVTPVHNVQAVALQSPTNAAIGGNHHQVLAEEQSRAGAAAMVAYAAPTPTPPPSPESTGLGLGGALPGLSLDAAFAAVADGVTMAVPGVGNVSDGDEHGSEFPGGVTMDAHTPAATPSPEPVVQVGGATGGDADTAAQAATQAPQSPGAASALTGPLAPALHRSPNRHKTPKVNLLTADISAEQGALEIDKSVVVKLLSDGGLYAIRRNEGFWFYRSKKNSPVSPLGKMGASGSDTIKNLRALASGEGSDGKISLAAVRSAITWLSVRKDFVNHYDSCGTTRVLKEINKEFNKVANKARAPMPAAVI
jgi:hypothetical protein